MVAHWASGFTQGQSARLRRHTGRARGDRVIHLAGPPKPVGGRGAGEQAAVAGGERVEHAGVDGLFSHWSSTDELIGIHPPRPAAGCPWWPPVTARSGLATDGTVGQ